MIILTTEVRLLEAMTLRDVEYIGRYDDALERAAADGARPAQASGRGSFFAARVKATDLRS